MSNCYKEGFKIKKSFCLLINDSRIGINKNLIYFSVKTFFILHPFFSDKIERWTGNGSGYVIDAIQGLYLNCYEYSPLAGTSYLPTPQKIKDKRCIRNLKNKDNKV